MTTKFATDGECQFRYRHLDDVIEHDVTRQQRTLLETPLRYKNIQEKERDFVDQVFHGGVVMESIPPAPTRTVRVYISSAGSDTELERRIFAEQVYPDLRDYCRNTYGIDFQAVDMKFPTVQNDKCRLPPISCCLRELKKCKNSFMGPCFMSFVGNKYKRYTPPEAIPSPEWEQLVDILKSMGKDTSLLDNMYMEDKNSDPSTMNLSDTEHDESVAVLSDVHFLLLEAAIKARDNGVIGDEEFVKYTSSDLEIEFEELLADTSPTNIAHRCVSLIRNFTDNRSIPGKMKPYLCDISPHTNDIDMESARDLHDFKENLIKILPKDKVLISNVECKNGLTVDRHAEYIRSITRFMFSALKNIIHDDVTSQSPLQDDDLFVEVSQHWNVAIESSKLFVDRKDVLRIVKDYLLSETDQPLVLVGEPGAGKTAFVAKIVSDINVAVREKNLGMRTTLVFRFIGQSQCTNTAQKLLYSLCHQLAYVMGRYRHEVPTDYKKLKLYFIDMLQRGEFGGMIIIALDSLHLLSTCENGHKLEWLPSRIAQNVKFIVTASTENPDICQRLLNKCTDSYFPINPLLSTDCESMMKKFMNERKRIVDYDGWKEIQFVFSSCTLPLFIKTTLEESCTRQSYGKNPNLGSTMVEAIDLIFDEVEIKHGSFLVSTVLGYISAVKYGLSMVELLDVLSIDEDVLNIVYCDWQPPIRRMAPNKVLPVLQSLEPYLYERRSYGVQAIFWRHQLFQKRAEERYLVSDEGERIHSTLADYYLGVYGGSFEKEFDYPPQYVSKARLFSTQSKACRLLPLQPNSFGGTQDTEKFNMRKMTQLPYNLLGSGRHNALRSKVFCNFDYLYCRIKGSSLQELLNDIDSFNDRQVTLVGDALRMSGSAVSMDINCLSVELTGRLLPHIKRYDAIKDLIYQCDLEAQRCCPLVPNCQIYSAPGGPLQYECSVGGNIRCPIDIDVFTSQDGILLTAKPYYSSRVQVWELSHGDPRPDMMMPVGEIFPTRDGKYLTVFQNDKSVKIFKSDCGEQHGEVEYGYGVMSDVEVSNKYMIFAVEKRTGPYVVDLERSILLHKFSFHTHAVAINQDDSYLTFNTGRSLVLYEIPLMERRCVAQVNDVPQDIKFISSSLTCFVLTKSKVLERVFFDVVSRKYKHATILFDLEIQEMVLSHTEQYLLLRAGRSLHQIDIATEKVLRKYQQLPQGLIVDPQSSFTGAGFTPNDELIVASRYTFLAVWKCDTGEPFRVLQSSISPITKMFTSDAVNKAVCLLEDNSFQVWNLDNIDTDFLHSNEILNAPVKSVNTSSQNMVACFEKNNPEVKLISTEDGRVRETLQHSSHIDVRVKETLFSGNGRFLITRGKTIEEETDNNKNSKTNFLCEDIVWSLESNRKIYHAINSRFMNFDNSSATLTNVSCLKCNPYDWSENTYCLVVITLATAETKTISFPKSTEFVSSPWVVRKKENNHNFFIAIVQSCVKTFVEQTDKEIDRRYKIGLFQQDLTTEDKEPVFFRLQHLVNTLGDDCHLMDALPMHGGKILLPYVKGISHCSYETSKGLQRPWNAAKGAVIYCFESGTCLQHIESFLMPNSNLNKVVYSRNYLTVLDTNKNVFFGENFSKTSEIETEFDHSTAQLALDGRVLIALSANHREVIIVRTNDGALIGHVFCHGRAICLGLGPDERTVSIGCEDGRVMILSLILEIADPIKNWISNLPSRKMNNINVVEKLDLIQGDIQNYSSKKPDLMRLSSRIKSAKSEKRPPSRQSISDAVMVTQNMNAENTESCHVQ